MMNTATRVGTVVLCMVALLAPCALGADYYYDPSDPGWHAVSAWSTTSASGPFDQNWVDGNTARFNFTAPTDVNLGGTSAQVAGLVNDNVGRAWLSSAANLTFTAPATISGGSGGFQFRVGLTAVGPFTVTDGPLYMTDTASLSGTMTVQGGSIFPQPSTLTTNSHFSLSGGTLTLQESTAAYAFGAVSLSGSGEIRIGQYSGGAAVSATLSSLSGTGGGVYPRMVSYAGGDVVQSLTVNQRTDTTFSGALDGYDTWQGTNYIAFTKSGAGDLTLAGTVDLRQGTTVTGGRLYLNGGSSKTFDHVAGGSGTNAIEVTGGALGGTASISVLNGTDVAVFEGGGLVAGTGGTANSTTYAFAAGQGGELDISSATASNAWLHFDLGSTNTPGTTYDQIQVTGGTLAIGTALLSINDFSFTELPGLEAGTYVLFNNAALSGSLGTAVSGQIVPRWDGTLRLSGHDIVLDVVPQPTGTTITVR